MGDNMKSLFKMALVLASVCIHPLTAHAQSEQGWRLGLTFVQDGTLGTEVSADSPEFGGIFRVGLAAAERVFESHGAVEQKATLVDPQLRASFSGAIGTFGSGSSKVTQYLVSSWILGRTQARFSGGESAEAFAFLALRFGIHLELGKTLLGSGLTLRSSLLTEKQQETLDKYTPYEKKSLFPYLTMRISI